MTSPVFAFVASLVCWSGVAALLVTPREKRYRGRVSRALRRAGLPSRRMPLLRVALWATGPIDFNRPDVVFWTPYVALALWAIDDWLCRNDDDEREGKTVAAMRKWLGALRPLGYSTATAPQT